MPGARPRSGTTGGGNVRGGYEGVVDPATRRALIDLRRNAEGVPGPPGPAGPMGPQGPPGTGGGGGTGGYTFVQDGVPTATALNQTWYETDTGASYIWLNDGTSTQWVQTAPGGGSRTHVHNQGTPATTWTIVHNLGFFPNVMVIDSGLSVAEGDITQIDLNTLRLQFSSAFAGTAYLS